MTVCYYLPELGAQTKRLCDLAYSCAPLRQQGSSINVCKADLCSSLWLLSLNPCVVTTLGYGWLQLPATPRVGCHRRQPRISKLDAGGVIPVIAV
jgi:hypothetical protein